MSCGAEDADGAARKFVALLTARALTVAAAESLTGGAVAAALVAVPGVSAVFQGGVVAYQNNLKVALLGVPAELLERRGSVDPQVAAAMARGVQRLTGARLAIATTGAAGPQAHECKPVGTVYIAVLLDQQLTIAARRFCGDRAQVRSAVVTAAVSLAAESIRRTDAGRVDAQHVLRSGLGTKAGTE